MKGRMLFIFNPRSGKGQIRNKLMDIIDVFVKGGYEVVVHPTQGAKDAEKMAKSMAEEVDLIVCSGGDGTLDEVVTGLMEIGANVPLGYIPAGSTNDFASSLEIPQRRISWTAICFPWMWEALMKIILSMWQLSACLLMFRMKQARI